MNMATDMSRCLHRGEHGSALAKGVHGVHIVAYNVGLTGASAWCGRPAPGSHLAHLDEGIQGAAMATDLDPVDTRVVLP